MKEQLEQRKQLERLVGQVLLEKGESAWAEEAYMRVRAYPEEELRLLGAGRSAAVFQIRAQPALALKVFGDVYRQTAEQEVEAYRRLGTSIYYPALHASGENWLLIDYIAGKTFYQCLLDGTQVTEELIAQVDRALAEATARGLYPNDVHLKNILLTPEGGVKLIDIARFVIPKPCTMWEDLKRAYYYFYRRRIFPKKLPEETLQWVMRNYHRLRRLPPQPLTTVPPLM